MAFPIPFENGGGFTFNPNMPPPPLQPLQQSQPGVPFNFLTPPPYASLNPPINPTMSSGSQNFASVGEEAMDTSQDVVVTQNKQPITHPPPNFAPPVRTDWAPTPVQTQQPPPSLVASFTQFPPPPLPSAQQMEAPAQAPPAHLPAQPAQPPDATQAVPPMALAPSPVPVPQPQPQPQQQQQPQQNQVQQIQIATSTNGIASDNATSTTVGAKQKQGGGLDTAVSIEDQQKILRQQALKSMMAKQAGVAKQVSSAASKDKPAANESSNGSASNSAGMDLVDSFLEGCRKNVEASSKASDASHNATTSTSQPAHAAPAAKVTVPAQRSTAATAAAGQVKNVRKTAGFAARNDAPNSLVVHFDDASDEEQEETIVRKVTKRTLETTSSAAQVVIKKAKSQHLLTRRTVSTTGQSGSTPSKVSTQATNLPSNALENKIALLKSKIQQKKMVKETAPETGPSPPRSAEVQANSSSAVQGKTAPLNRPNSTSPVTFSDEVSGTGALSIGSLLGAREDVERKLRGIRKMIEDNLREELEMQRELAELETTVREQQAIVENAQDFLNRELVRQSEFLDL